MLAAVIAGLIVAVSASPATALTPTTTTLTAAPNPSVFGQAVTFTATVTSVPPGGTPTGTVTFNDGAGLTSTVTLNGSGQASFTTNSLPVSTSGVTATYSGDANFQISTSPPLSDTVNQASTTTVLTAGPDPSVFGQAVTFTATVSAVAPGSGTPTGTVTFNDGAGLTSTVTLNGSGQASFTTNSLPVSTSGVTATYSGDANFQISTSPPLSDTVNQATTTTSLTTSVNPSTSGQAVTFTATVTTVAPGSGTPTGTVNFFDGATLIASASLAGGVATFTTNALTAGGHSITATYGGSANFLGSTSAVLSQTVTGANASTTVLAAAPNPSSAGQNVTFSATVASAGAPGTPTGSVTFRDGTTLIGTATLAGGTGSFTTSALAAGAHTIIATYSGDTTFTVSTGSLTQTVQGPAQSTTTTLSSSENPSTLGQAVTFSATVASSGGAPTGTVTFLDGGHAIGTGVLAAGVATFTTASLTIGVHSITASYGGSAGFLASTSAALSQAVNTPADSVRLRTMQVEGAQIVAQASGDAISEAIAAAISDGFSDGAPFATPSASGAHINFAGQLAAAEQAAPDVTGMPDPALGRATVLSDNGLTPAMRNFTASPSSNPSRTQPASTNPVQTSQAPALVGTPQAWLVWADVRGSGWNTDSSSGDIRGTQTNELLGITRRLTPDFLIGALGGYEHFDYSSQLLNGRLQGDGWTAGGYLGWRIDQQIRFDAAIARSGVSYNDTAGTATGSFPGSRWIASSGLTGTYKLQTFEIEPSARVFTLWEHEQPYTDSLGTPQGGFSFNTGRASGGFKLSYPWSWSPTTTLTPYVGFYGDYYFSNNNNATPLLLPTEFIRGGAARLTAGLAARFDNGIKVSIGGEYGGIGNSFQNWTVMGRVIIPLSTLFGAEPSTAARTAAPVPSAMATPAPAEALRARQVASLEPVATPVTQSAIPSAPAQVIPTQPAEQIVVRFSESVLTLTPSGIRALDEAVADAIAGKPVQIVIEGCGTETDYSKGSTCARRALSLRRLLVARGVSDPSQFLAELL